MDIKEIFKASREFGIWIIPAIGGILLTGIGFLVTPFTHALPAEKFNAWGKVIDLVIGSLGLIAFFAGFIILLITKRMKTPKTYRPDDGLVSEFKLNTKCDTLHKVSIQNYSRYAEQLINNKPNFIFTVCTFEPSEIMYFLCDELSKKDRTTYTLDDIQKHANFTEMADEFFPHFKKFKEYYKKNESGHHNIIRILVLKDTNFKSRHEKWMFEKFKELNGEIFCKVITKNHFEPSQITFITDHVVYDDKFVIDYYEESNTFILSCVENEQDLSRILLGIRDHYRANESHYQELNAFIENTRW